MDEWLKLLLTTLVVWRVVHMLAHEDGPLEVFAKLRIRAGAYIEEEEWVSDRLPGQLLICPLCMSVWLSIPFACIYATDVFWGFLYWLGISGAASFLELVTSPRR